MNLYNKTMLQNYITIIVIFYFYFKFQAKYNITNLELLCF